MGRPTIIPGEPWVTFQARLARAHQQNLADKEVMEAADRVTSRQIVTKQIADRVGAKVTPITKVDLEQAILGFVYSWLIVVSDEGYGQVVLLTQDIVLDV